MTAKSFGFANVLTPRGYKLVLTCALLGAYCAFGETIPQGADLATMHDYFYYTNQSGSARAVHAIMYGGTYTLSEDKVWSRLSIGTTIEEPVVLDLCGNTLTLTGCDSPGVPFVGYDNTTVVISNGTIRTVYDETAYPWTIDHPDWYQYRRGAQISRDGSASVGGSQLIIAKDGCLKVENGDTSSVRCTAYDCANNSLVVEEGGKLDARISFYGKDNRYIFKKGSTFSQISYYVVDGQFPKNIWFRSVTNQVIEICDSKILTDAGVTKLTPDAWADNTSFRSGLCLNGSDASFTNSTASFGYGSLAACLLELKNGAKFSISNEVLLGQAPAGSGTMLSIDGVGSAIQFLRPDYGWAGSVGRATNSTDNVLRLTNGATFDALGKSFGVGNPAGSNSNLIEVLSGSHFAASPLSIGQSTNYCNRVVVSGEGSTMTNSHINIGSTYLTPGGGHSLTVTDHADVLVMKSQIYLGYKSSGGCLLEVSDFAKVSVTNDANGNVIMGHTDNSAHTCSNRVVVCNGGSLEVKKDIQAAGDYSQLVVSNGTVSVGRLFASAASSGANALVLVAGPYAYLKCNGFNFNNGYTLRVVVPEEGFQDREGSARAPLSFPNGFTSIGDPVVFEVDAREFVRGRGEILQTPILNIPGGISDDLFSKITLVGDNCRLARSGDRTTLSVVKKNGFVLFVR